MSTLIVGPATPGLEIVRGVGYGGHDICTRICAHHKFAFRRPFAGKEGGGLSSRRSPRWRPHSHAMRTIAKGEGYIRRDVRSVMSRRTKGERLADKQMVQERSPIPGLRSNNFDCWGCDR